MLTLPLPFFLLINMETPETGMYWRWMENKSPGQKLAPGIFSSNKNYLINHRNRWSTWYYRHESRHALLPTCFQWLHVTAFRCLLNFSALSRRTCKFNYSYKRASAVSKWIIENLKVRRISMAASDYSPTPVCPICIFSADRNLMKNRCATVCFQLLHDFCCSRY